MVDEGSCAMRRRPTPRRAGIGLRAQHHRLVIEEQPDVAWFEVHTENYFADAGPAVDALEAIRSHYPLSLHGVGLSLGSTDPFDMTHLERVARAVRRFEPLLVSEHLAWSSVEGRFANDLLPLPFTREAQRHLVARIQQVQEFLGRQLLVENISSYLQFRGAEMTEWEFLDAVADASGCGILLDINNIYVCAHNHGFAALDYIDAISPRHVREIHLAGHETIRCGGRDILLDTHSRPTCPAVWELYEHSLRRFGVVPTLIEWDNEVPTIYDLQREACVADALVESLNARAA